MEILTLLSASDTKISDAALYALVGFLIVLAVLAILVGIFYLMGFLFRTKALSKDKLFERKPKKAKNSDADANTDEENDEELFAVISAVISSIYDSEALETSAPDFVIRRISRKK